MFSTALMAQETAAAVLPPQPGIFESLLPILLILVVFWFLILRPQSKRMKQHREMIANVSRGDTVVTSGGIVAKVTRVKEDDAELEVEIADGVRVKVLKSTLSEVRTKGAEAVKADKADKKEV